MKRILISISIGIFLLSACASAIDFEISNAWIRPAMKEGNGAVYFVLHNHSVDQDTLTGISSDVAQAVEMHETKMEGDVMQMQQVLTVPFPENSKIEFAPGGLHAMLIDLKQDLQPGDEIRITLEFADHADITLTVPVQESSDSMEDH